MSPILRNTFTVLTGFVLGSAVNLGILSLGMKIVPLPEGADVSTAEGLEEAMKSFKPANFLVPFLAHAMGTLVGAFVVAKFAASHAQKLAFVIGGIFLAGGITMVAMVGGPPWFIALDLIVAYLPMAWLGARMGAGPAADGGPTPPPNPEAA